MTQPDPRAGFLAIVRDSLRGNTFRRLVLGKPRGGSGLRKLTIEPGDGRLRLLYSHATRDITKHGDVAHVLSEVETSLGTKLFSAHLFTPNGTPQFEINKKGEGRLTRGPAAGPAAIADRPHDRTKVRRIMPASAPWMHALGLATAGGTVITPMQGKYRQIEKFVEIIDRLVAEAGFTADAPPTVVDMGSGKGCLTFGLWHHLNKNLGMGATVTGVEVRQELVDLCNAAAVAHTCTGLTFVAGEIASAAVPPADFVIALHACDTATDDALFHAAHSGARVIVSAPCCHKELRRQIRPPQGLEAMMREGIQLERMAELLTDAVRARLLEAAGYRTQVFEFISTEHTSKNTMITAVRLPRPDESRMAAARDQAVALLGAFGISHQRLAERLGIRIAGSP